VATCAGGRAGVSGAPRGVHAAAMMERAQIVEMEQPRIGAMCRDGAATNRCDVSRALTRIGAMCRER
jgi:hypothetical protein